MQAACPLHECALYADAAAASWPARARAVGVAFATACWSARAAAPQRRAGTAGWLAAAAGHCLPYMAVVPSKSQTAADAATMGAGRLGRCPRRRRRAKRLLQQAPCPLVNPVSHPCHYHPRLLVRPSAAAARTASVPHSLHYYCLRMLMPARITSSTSSSCPASTGALCRIWRLTIRLSSTPERGSSTGQQHTASSRQRTAARGRQQLNGRQWSGGFARPKGRAANGNSSARRANAS